jgi:hypothetical protein
VEIHTSWVTWRTKLKSHQLDLALQTGSAEGYPLGRGKLPSGLSAGWRAPGIELGDGALEWDLTVHGPELGIGSNVAPAHRARSG